MGVLGRRFESSFQGLVDLVRVVAERGGEGFGSLANEMGFGDAVKSGARLSMPPALGTPPAIQWIFSNDIRAFSAASAFVALLSFT